MTDQRIESQPGISRRTAVVDACLVAGAVTLSACTAYDTSVDAPAADTVETPRTGQPITAATSVPVGGGLVNKNQKLVVTQPKKGEFKGFRAVCTHAGCIVADVAGGTINCTCHGSKFSISDGSVVAGPAKEPLTETPVTVDGANIIAS